MSDRKFLFLLSSARHHGNAETLARHAAKRLPSHVKQEWLRHSDLPLPPFEDIRHEGSGIYPAPTGNARNLLDATLAATDIVFVAPVYWYTVPAAAKIYLDYWSGWMRVKGLDFRPRMGGKSLWAVTILSDTNFSEADPTIGMLKLGAEYMKMHWKGALIGYGNKPGDVMEDAPSVTRAEKYFSGV